MHRLANYYTQGPRSFFRLLDRGGRSKAVSAHHSAQEYVDACLEAARIGENRRGPLFRSCEPERHDTLQSLKVWSLRETRYGSVERYTRNFKRWRGGEMIQRWVSAALLDAERRFRRVRGFLDMPRLMLALDDPSTHFKQPEIAAWNPKSRISPPASSTALGTTPTGKNRIFSKFSPDYVRRSSCTVIPAVYVAGSA